jgi:tRNA (cytidine/uridine-2'-O-)-methyltransferase
MNESGKNIVNVVLFEPEIPQNTGNIMRTCVATGAVLHIIGPVGFDIDNPEFRRASTNHITWAEYTLYDSWQDFADKNDGEYFFMTRYGKVPPSDIDFKAASENANIYLIFGKESTGIDKTILRNNLDRCMRIPMKADARSLNLSNCVALVLYQVLDQLGFPGLSLTEVIKGEDFLTGGSLV